MTGLVPGLVLGLFACAVVVVGCAPRNAVVVVPTLEVAVNPASGRPLDTSDPDPREDGRSEGELVEVEWRGSWWPGTLLERRGARWLVHYDGYEKDWDEVVTIERIRDRGPRIPEPAIEPMDEDVDP
jgi:hypothetical protein